VWSGKRKQGEKDRIRGTLFLKKGLHAQTKLGHLLLLKIKKGARCGADASKERTLAPTGEPPKGGESGTQGSRREGKERLEIRFPGGILLL